MTLAIVERRNGAYLIGYVGEEWEAARPQEMFDAAASLRSARRIARQEVEAHEAHEGPYRWERIHADRWDLTGTFVARWDAWEDDGEDDAE